MYQRPILAQKKPAQRKSDLKKFHAPTGGWISNRNLSTPMENGGPQGAAVLDNFFPTSTTAILRRGKELYATLGQGDEGVTSLFTYVNGLNRKLFASTENTIYDITNILVPYNYRLVTENGDYLVTENGDYFGQSSTEDMEAFEGALGGNWITVQFATTGGIYLIGVNGASTGFIYDGNAFYPYIPGGVWALSYDNVIQDFSVGEVITGDTSGAEGTVSEILPGGGLVLKDIVNAKNVYSMSFRDATDDIKVGMSLEGVDSGAKADVKTVSGVVSRYAINYVTKTANFTVGETVTGGTSSATCVVVSINADDDTKGQLVVSTVSGAFVVGEKLTGSVSGAATSSTVVYTRYDGNIEIEGMTGSFVSGELIRGADGITAYANSSPVYISGGSFLDNEMLTGDQGGSAQAASVLSNIVPGVAFPDGLTTADMSYVWAFKNRLWFAQKESLNIWYMDAPDAVGGDPVVYPMGGILTLGGSVLWGDSWSMGTGAAGGLSDQMVVTSTEGEVAVFQGSYPEATGDWSHVGTYRIGRPLGNRAHFRGGGDIAVATSVGLIPLSKAISLDVTALSPAAVSYNIQDAWQQAVDGRGLEDWSCMLWPERKMAIISPPITIGDYDPVLFISNSETGAWCRYTNWDARAMCVFQGEMYFGGPNGEVFKANVTGMDNGSVYTGVYIPLFDDLGSPANLKIPKMGRGVARAKANLSYGLRFKADFDIDPGSAPTASSADCSNAWGTGVWGQSVWGGTNPNVFNAQWKSLGGTGYYVSACYQVTSGSSVPLDVEIVHLEISLTMGEIVT
ncbi:hypothetical protein [Brucella phage Fi]|uniref:Structural protein n=2 Tax=Perisivirus Tb TaxID=1984800 RepID=X2CYN9_9CAUD|nr:structural protein [Brucella phage Fz]AHB81304.1 structural protein [Brucella phage Tb]CCP90059.1 hypothetical protein [Brucella phage Fi]